MSGGKKKQSWRDPILAFFTPEIAAVSRLSIVADPDQLLTEQGVLDGIRQRGFELIPFDDHVAFRYAFESRYRQIWDRGDQTKLVVVLRSGQANADALPFDLLEQARYLSRVLPPFSIGEIFKDLAPSVVACLDRSLLDPLYDALVTRKPGPLGENATMDFILNSVFKVNPSHISTTPELLQNLVRRHYRGTRLPKALDDRFVHLLRQTNAWKDWPLEDIVSDRASFLGFLEERWPLFIKRKVSEGHRVAEPESAYGLRFSGPEDLPFYHDDIRVYVDNLFVEGHLAPTDVVPKSAVADSWMAVGVVGDAESDTRDRFNLLVKRLDDALPEEDAEYTSWLDVASRWAEATSLRWSLPSEVQQEVEPSLGDLHDRLEERFATWMLGHYASLHNLAFLPKPVMVHHVPRYLAHHFDAHGKQRHAVVVVDGMALDQWIVIRESLASDSSLFVEEGAVFAWVPTLTSVSRQSIFAGDPPFYFSASIGSTHKEEHHWRRFWEDQGARRNEIAYVCQKKQEDEDGFVGRVRECAEHPKCRMLGVVVGTIDQTMHGTVMGTGGMHASIRHWAGIGRFKNIVELLRSNGFDIIVTADHGNIEGVGMGKPNVGAIADERGQRAHVFRDDLTRAKVQDEYSDTITWPQVGIPEDYRALLAGKRNAFMHEGKRAVAHGGISIEEVIVPFVRIQEAK